MNDDDYLGLGFAVMGVLGFAILVMAAVVS